MTPVLVLKLKPNAVIAGLIECVNDMYPPVATTGFNPLG